MKTRKRKRSNDQGCPPAAQSGEASPQLPAAVPTDQATPLPAPQMIPAVNAAGTLRYWADDGQGDLLSLVAGFAAQAKSLRQGDLTDAERMLMAQATTLDVIFNQLARRAAMNIDQSSTACDAYLRLALKAQTQCRATLETLSLVKNPRSVSFVSQANIANGPQQVNNGTPPPTSHAENENRESNYSEQQSNVSLDTRTSQATIRIDSAMETVGKVHRTTNAER